MLSTSAEMSSKAALQKYLYRYIFSCPYTYFYQHFKVKGKKYVWFNPPC